jgi:SOS-response transcriptional repressor LexA
VLTPAHHELLSIIDARIAESGVTPSYQELADAMGLKSKSVVYRMVNCLEERGYVRRLPNKARAIEVIRRPGSDILVEALRQIASHNNSFLTDGSEATRACLDWCVKTAQDALAQHEGADYGQRPEVL